MSAEEVASLIWVRAYGVAGVVEVEEVDEENEVSSEHPVTPDPFVDWEYDCP